MSVLEVLASIPCINSTKLADTIMRECAGKGLAISFYKREPIALAPKPVEVNVPPVTPLPEDGA